MESDGPTGMGFVHAFHALGGGGDDERRITGEFTATSRADELVSAFRASCIPRTSWAARAQTSTMPPATVQRDGVSPKRKKTASTRSEQVEACE